MYLFVSKCSDHFHEVKNMAWYQFIYSAGVPAQDTRLMQYLQKRQKKFKNLNIKWRIYRFFLAPSGILWPRCVPAVLTHSPFSKQRTFSQTTSWSRKLGLNLGRLILWIFRALGTSPSVLFGFFQEFFESSPSWGDKQGFAISWIVISHLSLFFWSMPILTKSGIHLDRTQPYSPLLSSILWLKSIQNFLRNVGWSSISYLHC